jgi:hypothetical protein
MGIIYRSLILLVIAIILIVNYSKCNEMFNYEKVSNESKFLTKFTKNISMNMSLCLRIPFCSCLYDGKRTNVSGDIGLFSQKGTTLYYLMCMWSICFYFFLEIFVYSFQLLISSSDKTFDLILIKTKIRSPFKKILIRIFLTILIVTVFYLLLLSLIPIFFFYLACIYYVISILSEILKKIFYTDHSLKIMLSFFPKSFPFILKIA